MLSLDEKLLCVFEFSFSILFESINKVVDQTLIYDHVDRTQMTQPLGFCWMEWTICVAWSGNTLQVRLCVLISSINEGYDI